MINFLNTELFSLCNETVRILHIPFMMIGIWTAIIILRTITGGKK